MKRKLLKELDRKEVIAENIISMILILCTVALIIILIYYNDLVKEQNTYYSMNHTRMNKQNTITFDIKNELKNTVTASDIKTDTPYYINSSEITEDIDSNNETDSKDNVINSNDDFNLSVNKGTIKIDTKA